MRELLTETEVNNNELAGSTQKPGPESRRGVGGATVKGLLTREG